MFSVFCDAAKLESKIKHQGLLPIDAALHWLVVRFENKFDARGSAMWPAFVVILDLRAQFLQGVEPEHGRGSKLDGTGPRIECQITTRHGAVQHRPKHKRVRRWASCRFFLCPLAAMKSQSTRIYSAILPFSGTCMNSKLSLFGTDKATSTSRRTPLFYS